MADSASVISSLDGLTFPGLYVANINLDITSTDASAGSYTFSSQLADQGETRSGLSDNSFQITSVSTTAPTDDANALGTLTVTEFQNGAAQPSFTLNVLGFNGNTIATGLAPADTTSSNPYQQYFALSDSNLGANTNDNQSKPSYPETFNAGTVPSFVTPHGFDLTTLVNQTYPGLNVADVNVNPTYTLPAQQVVTVSSELANQGETRSGLADNTFQITAATNGAPSSDPNAVGTITVVETQNGAPQPSFVLNVLGYTNNAFVTGLASTVASDGTYSLYFEFSDVNIGTKASDNPKLPSFPMTFTAFNATNFTPPCFVTGSRILTTRGEVAVEKLAVGDVAIAASGAERAIVWIGHRTVSPGQRAELQPVCVAAGAFADGMPNADLWLSPGHSVFADGVLIPVSFLINGVTITQHSVPSVTYWHVELDAHDILVSQGLPSESYLDTGNRSSFSNGAAVVSMVPNFAPVVSDLSCAMLVQNGPVLAAVRERLLGRIAAFGYVEAEHEGLRILADGVRVAALQNGRTLRVNVPAGTRVLTLVSSSGVPSHHDAQSSDQRRLGVAITGLRLGSLRNLAQVALDDARLTSGFHAVEGNADGAWRWTDGRATIALSANSRSRVTVVEVEVMPTALWVDYVAADVADVRLAS